MLASPYYWWAWFGGGFIGYIAGVYVLRARGVYRWSTIAPLVAAAFGLWIGAKWHDRLEHYPVLEALAIHPADLLTPGMRLPLGLVVGALAAAVTCFVVRAPWRETGDALAVAASTQIAIGRIGCLLNGCCMGTVCGTWMRPVCVRYGPGTEAYDQQVVLGLITSASPTSLPAHPLPLYFGLASLVTLVVLFWLLRRGAAPGTLLATFCIVRPTTKLVLETLRVTAPGGPTGLMLAIPTGVLLVTAVVIGVHRRRPRGLSSGVSAVAPR